MRVLYGDSSRDGQRRCLNGDEDETRYNWLRDVDGGER